jgi:hypothetical protein
LQRQNLQYYDLTNVILNSFQQTYKNVFGKRFPLYFMSANF